MHARSVFISLLLALTLALCGNAFAGGTVGFTVKWYNTPTLLSADDGLPVRTGIVMADLNRDGIPDVAYTYPGGVIVKLGTGGGNLGPDNSYTASESDLGELETADINGDGYLDLMVREVGNDEIFLLLNNGDGTFHLLGGLVTDGIPGSFTLGDFNHDGKIDAAVIDCDSPVAAFPVGAASCKLDIYLGDNQSFALKQTIQLADASYNLQCVDINGDGNLDLIFVRDSVGVILWGRENGTFSGSSHLKPPTTLPMDAVAVGDFNNDARLDVALLSGNPCRPTPDDSGCDGPNPNTVWMYKNNGGANFTLTSHAPFAAQAGSIVPADINGDLNQDLIYYNPFAEGMSPVLSGLGQSGKFLAYALGQGKDILGSQGTLPDNSYDVAVAFRDMNGDSRADYAVVDWNEQLLGIAIQTGGWKNCTPPNSAKLAAKICGISNGATVSSPLLVKASGNSPAGVNQLQVWIDGKKQYVKWGDQLSKKFTLSAGSHRISVVANDKYVGHASTVINLSVH